MSTIEQQIDYKDKQDQAEWLIKQITMALKDHRRQAHLATEIGNWGYNGDLGHVNEQLTEIVKFLRNKEE